MSLRNKKKQNSKDDTCIWAFKWAFYCLLKRSRWKAGCEEAIFKKGFLSFHREYLELNQRPLELQSNALPLSYTPTMIKASGPSVDSYTILPKPNQRWSQWKLFLRKGNRKKRMVCAKLHKNWTENQWQQDERRTNPYFKILVQNVNMYCWRRSGEKHNSECLQPSEQHVGAFVEILS